MISNTNHFTFTPLLAEVVGGSLGQQHVTLPHRILASRRGFEFVRGSIEGLDTDACIVYTTAGEIPFDYAVAGAGPAGVEAASEIWHLLTEVLPRYYDLKGTPRVVIIDGGDRILKGWDEKLAAEGLEVLRRRGVEVRLGTRVEGYDGRTVRMKQEEGTRELEADTLVWTAGMTPNVSPLEEAGLTHTDTGHLSVDEYLRLKGLGHIYAVGDVASLVNPCTGEPYPPVAPIAINQGLRAAGNIENSIAGRPLEAYSAHHAGKIVSLGNGVALVDVLGFRLRGFAAWGLYRAAYLLKLVGTQNKARAATTLLLNHVFERKLSCISLIENG